MGSRQEEAFLAYRRGRDLLAQGITRETLEERAQALTAALHTLWPTTRLCYCQLVDGTDTLSVARDDTGASAPAWAEALAAPVDHWLNSPASATAGPLEDLPPGVPGPLYLVPVHCQGTTSGVLGVAGIGTSPVDVLAELGEYLGARMLAQAVQKRERQLLVERDQQMSFAILADLVSPVSHELQNVFNNLVLQAAILSRLVDDEIQPEVEVVRRVSLKASKMMHRLDEFRYRLVVPRHAVDLNAIVTTTCDEIETGPAVKRNLAASLPPVWGNENDLGRLVRLLVRNAHAVVASQGAGAVTVSTQSRNGKVVLRIEDNGPSVEDDPGIIFEPFEEGERPGASSLELGACQGLARKLRLSLQAKTLTPQGMAITVELEPVS
jgi:signal transduction histidine kinase